MSRFMLMHGCGIHIGEDGAVHEAGDVVESDGDLAAAFRNKFVKVDDAAKREGPKRRSGKART